MNASDPERIVRGARTIAIVGLSADPSRPSFDVARYLQRHGYRIIPVNPLLEHVLGEQAYPSVDAVPTPIDVVDVFRRAEHAPEVARDAVRAGAGTLWLQLGITSSEARRIAVEGGLAYVENRCIKIEHARLPRGDR